jgi:hypothetical protein
MTELLLEKENNEKRYVIYRVDCAVLRKLTSRSTQYNTIEAAERGAENHIRNVYGIRCIQKKIPFDETAYQEWRKTYDTQFVILEYTGPYKSKIVKLIN